MEFVFQKFLFLGVCLVRSLSFRSLSFQEFFFQEFVFQEFVFQEFVFQEFVMAPLKVIYKRSLEFPFNVILSQKFPGIRIRMWCKFMRSLELELECDVNLWGPWNLLLMWFEFKGSGNSLSGNFNLRSPWNSLWIWF